MRRVLVIKDVGLWISLNRHLAGSRSVQLTEAPSLELGLTLARTERPALVVLSTESTGLSAEQIHERVRERGGEGIPVLCVSKEGDGRRLDPQFRIASLEGFLDGLGELVDLDGEEGLGPRVDLLAHFERPSTGGGVERGFANLLELSDSEALLESDEGLEVGDRLTLTFFVAGRFESDARQKVAAEAEVLRAQDSGKQLYTVALRVRNDESRNALRDYVGRLCSVPEGSF